MRSIPSSSPTATCGWITAASAVYHKLGRRNMSTNAMILLLVAIAAVAVLAILIYRWERSKKPRQQFGPEYSRTVQETGSKARAEAKLGQLKKRVERFHIRPLTPGDRTRFADSWRAVQ